MFGCDLRAAPRKNLLRFLAEHTTNMVERHHLMQLSSRQGNILSLAKAALRRWFRQR